MAITVDTVHDLRRSTRNMIDGAIAVATGRLKLETPQEAMAMICDSDPIALQYFRHELAHQIASLLLWSDGHVEAVFKEHELPEAEELEAPEITLSDPIHLVVYSERETAALRSLIDAVDYAVTEAISERCGAVARGFINVQVFGSTRRQRMRTRRSGFRPPPVLLVSRNEHGSRRDDDVDALGSIGSGQSNRG